MALLHLGLLAGALFEDVAAVFSRVRGLHVDNISINITFSTGPEMISSPPEKGKISYRVQMQTDGHLIGAGIANPMQSQAVAHVCHLPGLISGVTHGP